MKQPALIRNDRPIEMLDTGLSFRPIGLGTLFAILRQNLLWIAAATFSALALSVAILLVVQPRFQSQVTLVVTKPLAPRPVDGTVAGANPPEISDPAISSLLDEIIAAPIVR